ncbi:MAG: UDP-N-acetylmuramate dehydrogenase [Oscillospiraceae bacterium]|jgi:UDP-N-acetylmuramate dehydrogenase|nr:UDP-N-acetylmuramate dehydrogenase [Oscillospiraceae bacterium]
MEKMEKFAAFAKELGVNVLRESMSLHTTFQIGGVAFFAQVGDLAVLMKIMAYLQGHDIDYQIIGNGSNLLVSDSKMDKLFIKLVGNEDEVFLEDETLVRAPAGISLQKLCDFVLEHSLTGLEFAHGIPGTLGGAIYMNASAYGKQMSDVLESIFCLDDSGNPNKMEAGHANLGYRHSVFMGKKYCITGALLLLAKGNKTEIKKEMDFLWEKRQNSQPLDLPSAGSVFKRPKTGFAGALIEECGLKGMKVGGAAVSEKHAGFIVNLGGASCDDVRELIKEIQDIVWQQRGVRLETEVEFVK